MYKQLTKLSLLHKNELRDIHNLVERSAEHDRFRVKLYWNILQNRLTQEFNDFLYYIDGNLAGYLGLFTFELDEAEISLVVHPKYRRHGIGKKLFAEAMLELKQRNISKSIWVRPHGSIINDERLQAMQPELLYAQQEMIAKNPPQFDVNTLPPVQFRLATVEDIPLVAKMGTVSFNSKFTDNMTRFTENMQEKVRKIWLVSTPEHENVGKIHVRFDDNQTAFLHDLCIAPEFRGQDLAKAMIMQMMDMLRKQGQRVIALDVECDNTNALALYDRCGFVSVGAYDYLRIANRFFF